MGDIDAQRRAEGAIPPRLVGRTAAALFLVAGTVSVFTPFLPSDGGPPPYGVIIAGVAAILTGAVVWFLPWEAWPRSRSLWLVPIAFAYIALGNHFAEAEPFRYSIFFVVAFMCIGMLHPPGTSLAFTPLFALAYLGPFFTSGNMTITGLGSIAVVGPCCIVLGETVAWLSERARSAQAAFHRELSERRFRSVAQNSFDVLLILDQQGAITYASPAIERILGFTPAGQVGRDLLDLVDADDRTWLTNVFGQVHARPGSSRTLEFRVRTATGGRRLVQAMVKNLLGDPAVEGLLVDLRDITEQKALEDQLKHQAFHDSLTRLANRALFIDRVEHAVARLGRTPGEVAVVFIDLDDFKTVNDSLGHVAGDRLLVKVAERIRAHVRPSDTAARLGGDEFAILLEDLEPGSAEAVGKRILEAIAAPVELQHRELSAGASVGVAYASHPEVTAEELLRTADIAMYSAKSKGKRRVVVFEEPMRQAAVVRLELRGELERALERGEFSLLYQPLILLSDGSLHGVEALVRWEHPRRGTLLPSEFMALAEETGVIVPLGRWVLGEATRQARAWAEDHAAGASLSMSVNVSPRQLEDGELVGTVEAALRSAEMEPSRLMLEITETVLMRDPHQAEEVLRRLKALGVRIAIDDFGTGYSSLSHLHRFPIDILKIDRTFVAALGRGREESALVRSILRLGDTLRLQTVAEGIEDAAQLARLRRLGASMGQGYLFARPLAAADVTALLALSLGGPEPGGSRTPVRTSA